MARESAGPDPLVRVSSAFFLGGGDFGPENYDFVHIKLIFVKNNLPKFARFLHQIPEGSQNIKIIYLHIWSIAKFG